MRKRRMSNRDKSLHMALEFGLANYADIPSHLLKVCSKYPQKGTICCKYGSTVLYCNSVTIVYNKFTRTEQRVRKRNMNLENRIC